MPSPSRSTLRARSRIARTGATAAAAALALGLLPTTSASAVPVTAKKTVTPSTIVTPGNFTGYGFDQCVAPIQKSMTTWLENSPFLAVGIYISGNSRACRTQPNLSDTWVKTQLSAGWKVLPIVLGPQASCSTRYPKYSDDPTIKASRTNNYAAARAQGTAEAAKSAADAARYGIAKKSTIWYDLEAFDTTKTACRESALRFVSAWNTKLRALGYTPGFYSSAASGIRMLDDARVNRPGTFDLPSQVWIADWNGSADTESTYIRKDGWRNGGRMKQYRGGHNETWGGVTINIDSNYLNLGRGSTVTSLPNPCGTSASLNLSSFGKVNQANRPTSQVLAMQCLMKLRGHYTGALDGTLSPATLTAVSRFRQANGFRAGVRWTRMMWVKGLAKGARPVLKVGSAGSYVVRLQRTLNATTVGGLRVSGSYDAATRGAVIAYQRRYGHPATGIVTAKTWALLQAGRI